jgi:hypothetical protein
MPEIHDSVDDLQQVAELCARDLPLLSHDEAIDLLLVVQRATARLHLLQADLLVAAASGHPVVEELLVLDPRPDHDEERTIRIADAVREDISSALRLPPATAQNLIDEARLINGPLARTREALLQGEITPGHARVICEAAERLSCAPGLGATEHEHRAYGKACRALETRVLPTARRTTVARTRRRAALVLAQVDAEGQLRRRAAARCTRDVWVTAEPDGIGTLMARLDAVTARAMMAAVDAAVTDPRINGDCDANIGERRAEALAALVLGRTLDASADGSDQPDDRARVSLTAQLDVVIPYDVLAALGSDDTTPGTVLVSGTEAGVEQLRDLLADPEVRCTLRRLVTDPVTGQVLDVGRSRYEVTGPLRRLIVARDRTCRFPGCSRPAVRCQIDHATSWHDGGRTDACNLGPLCVRHHQLKTHANWEILVSRADGSCVWRSPSGRIYTRPPEPVVPPPPLRTRGAGPPAEVIPDIDSCLDVAWACALLHTPDAALPF